MCIYVILVIIQKKLLIRNASWVIVCLTLFLLRRSVYFCIDKVSEGLLSKCLDMIIGKNGRIGDLNWYNLIDNWTIEFFLLSRNWYNFLIGNVVIFIKIQHLLNINCKHNYCITLFTQLATVGKIRKDFLKFISFIKIFTNWLIITINC